MASGTPDYTQTVRQVYGSAKMIWNKRTVTASSRNTINKVLGKGIIYGGCMFLDYTSSQINSLPGLDIDDEALASFSFAEMAKYGISVENTSAFHMLRYDQKEFVYSAGISSGITFERYFETIYDEVHGTTPDVTGLIHYALLT